VNIDAASSDAIRKKCKENFGTDSFLPGVYILFPESLHRLANIGITDKLSKEAPAPLPVGSFVLRAP
jgi:hypothetical protein